MTNAAAQFVGSIPENYDKGLGPHLFEDFGDDIARRAAAAKPSAVLELAAGTGIVSRRLRDALPRSCRLVVTDLNAPMLDVARRKFARDEAVEFQTADAMELPFAIKEFDVVVCQFGVMFLPDKPKSFREARRVLQPGGRYLFNTWGPMSANPMSEVAYDVGAQFFPEYPPQFYRVPFGYSDAAIVIADLKQAGFRDIRHETLRIKKIVRDFTLLAQGIVYGNPLIDEIKNRDGVEPEEVKRAVIAALRKRFGDEPAPMPLEATVFEARAD